MFTPMENNGGYQYIPMAEPRDMLGTLPAGVYDPYVDFEGRVFFTPARLPQEHLINLNTSTAAFVQREIDSFFDQDITGRLSAARLKHRRGIILHGNAGTGKTSLVRSLLPSIVAYSAVVLLDPHISELSEKLLPAIRLTDPDRAVVVVFDEFHNVVRSSLGGLLSLLDGMTSPDHLMTIGTTNYMARIPTTLTQRPTRFSLVLEVPSLPRDVRVQYALHKFPMLAPDSVQSIVTLTENMALDYLEEALKLTLMGLSVEEIHARFQASKLEGMTLLSEEDLYSRGS